MPIRAEYRHFYRTPEWQAARTRVLKRAHYMCERCRKKLRDWVFTYTWQDWSYFPGQLGKTKIYHMIWISEGDSFWRTESGNPCSPLHAKGLPRKIRVKLTIAHADNNPANMDDLNLRCWCTWCHLHHDQPHHEENRSIRKDLVRDVLTSLTEVA